MLKQSIWVGISKVFPLFFVLAAIVGCNSGPKLYDVKGSVTVDGSPTGGIGLIFFDRATNSPVASATSGSDGSFSFTTDEGIGIPAGNYLVVARYADPKFVPEKTSMGAAPSTAPDLFAGRYQLSKSDVTIEITPESKDTAIVLSMKK